MLEMNKEAWTIRRVIFVSIAIATAIAMAALLAADKSISDHLRVGLVTVGLIVLVLNFLLFRNRGKRK